MAGSSNRQKELFLVALDLPSASERAAFLAEACGPDEALRRQVEAMLKAHAAPDSFLEKPAAAMVLTIAADGNADSTPAPGEGPGTQVGPYKLLEKIGEGGMGVVYMAQQHEPIRRMVALKIIKPGMDSSQVLARFEAERQALALMDHPNIARVLDAGATADGRPFFVMELVKGTPITTFCDERRLPARQRLELFVSVCQAIQHAHQKGIIHRDIKPSNVLVALYDDRPVPKVIDFGVAKAAGQPLTEMTLHTGFGAIVGTPEYMSPEQATFNQLDIDTRSDVYSLGVLLYELLTGTTPVDRTKLKENALLEVLRVVREEEPLCPSLRLSTSQARASIAATRSIGPEQLAQLLRGELDWIVMKALEKERNRRYETAAGLARDVDRYLKDEIVEARPPSLAYRLRKTIRRNHGVVLAALLVLLVLIAGMIGTTWGFLAAVRSAVEAMNQTMNAKNEAFEARKARDEAQRLAGLEEAARKRADQNARDAKFQALRADTARHANQMDTILRAWQRDDLQTATEILDEVPEAFRDTLECRFLRDVCRRRARPVPMTDGIFSPDRKTVAFLQQLSPQTSPTDRWRVTVKDVATGQERFSFNGSEIGGRVPFLDFDQRGKLLAFADGRTKKRGFRVAVWDVDKGAKLWSDDLEISAGGGGFAFSPDGKMLAITDLGGFSVRNATSGARLYQINEQTVGRFAGFSLDGKLLFGALATPAGNNHVKIYDAASGKEKLLIKATEEYALARATFSPDARSILAYGAGPNKTYSFEVFDVATGARKLLTKQAREPYIGYYDAGFLADSKALVIANGDHDVTVVDIASGERRPVVGPLGPTTCRRLDAGGRWVWTGSKLEWSVAKTPLPTRALKFPAGLAQQVIARQFSQDGSQIYLSHHWDLHTYDARTGEELRSIAVRPSDFNKGFPHQLMPMRFSPDGRWIAYRNDHGGYADAVRIFDAKSGDQVLEVPRPGPVASNFNAAFSRDSVRLVAVGPDQTIQIWNLSTKEIERSIPTGANNLHFPACGPDDQIAALVRRENLLIWNGRTGEKLAAIKVKVLQDMLFFPDGKRLLTRSEEFGKQPLLQVWDIATGQELGRLQFEAAHGYVNPIVPMLLNRDGTRLLIGNRIWDVATGQIVLLLPVNYSALAISPDDRSILALHDPRTATNTGAELVIFVELVIFDAP